MHPTDSDLRKALRLLDGRNYKELKALKGRYQMPSFILSVDHIQGDPFSAPSALHIEIDYQAISLSTAALINAERRKAAADFLQRRFFRSARTHSRRRGTGHSGLIFIESPGQKVLSRSALQLHERHLEVRFQVGMPAQGRRFLGRLAEAMLLEELTAIVQESLYAESYDERDLLNHCNVIEDAAYIRSQLGDRQLVAFIADGSILPRASGIDDEPMLQNVVPWRSPENLAVTFDCPHRGQVRGLGIRKGITLLIGGGYHGKSTVLQALEAGIYDHIPGDGREFVITDPDAVRVVSEPGRSIRQVDVSTFLKDLPNGQQTSAFSSDDASGSSSQAAALVEAIEAGSCCILLDEDQSAANFLVRDKGMEELLPTRYEPICALSQSMANFAARGISFVMVVGSTSQFFKVATTVIAMLDYLPHDYTDRAREVARKLQDPPLTDPIGQLVCPRPVATQILSPTDRNRKIRVEHANSLRIGEDLIDCRAVSQVVHPSQLRAIAMALGKLQDELPSHLPLMELAKELMHELEVRSWQAISTFPDGHLAKFRIHELLAVLNRCRALRLKGD